MFADKEIKESHQAEKRGDKKDKYKPLPRSRQTERELQDLFDHGTERELTKYLREHGVSDDSAHFAAILKLFREHGAKR